MSALAQRFKSNEPLSQCYHSNFSAHHKIVSFAQVAMFALFSVSVVAKTIVCQQNSVLWWNFSKYWVLGVTVWVFRCMISHCSIIIHRANEGYCFRFVVSCLSACLYVRLCVSLWVYPRPFVCATHLRFSTHKNKARISLKPWMSCMSLYTQFSMF